MVAIFISLQEIKKNNLQRFSDEVQWGETHWQKPIVLVFCIWCGILCKNLKIYLPIDASEYMLNPSCAQSPVIKMQIGNLRDKACSFVKNSIFWSKFLSSNSYPEVKKRRLLRFSASLLEVNFHICIHLWTENWWPSYLIWKCIIWIIKNSIDKPLLRACIKAQNFQWKNPNSN